MPFQLNNPILGKGKEITKDNIQTDKCNEQDIQPRNGNPNFFNEFVYPIQALHFSIIKV